MSKKNGKNDGNPKTPVSMFRRVSVCIWNDEKFNRLTPWAPSGQALLTLMLLHPLNGPIPGIICQGIAGLSEQLGWDPADTRRCLAELEREGMAKIDLQKRLIWLPNGIKHNMPDSGNNVIPWRPWWELVPECPLKAEAKAVFLAALAHLCPLSADWTFNGRAGSPPFSETRPIPGGEASPPPLPRTPPPHPWGEQKEDKEQDQNQEKETPPSEVCAEPTPSPSASLFPSSGDEVKEERKGKKAAAPLDLSPPPDAPEWQRSEAFAKAMADFADYRRRDLKKPIKAGSFKALYRKFAKHGLEAALWAIDESIANSWQGVFPEKYQECQAGDIGARIAALVRDRESRPALHGMPDAPGAGPAPASPASTKTAEEAASEQLRSFPDDVVQAAIRVSAGYQRTVRPGARSGCEGGLAIALLLQAGRAEEELAAAAKEYASRKEHDDPKYRMACKNFFSKGCWEEFLPLRKAQAAEPDGNPVLRDNAAIAAWVALTKTDMAAAAVAIRGLSDRALQMCDVAYTPRDRVGAKVEYQTPGVREQVDAEVQRRFDELGQAIVRRRRESSAEGASSP